MGSRELIEDRPVTINWDLEKIEVIIESALHDFQKTFWYQGSIFI